MQFRDRDEARGSDPEAVDRDDRRRTWRTPIVRRIEALDAQGGNAFHKPDLFSHLHS